MIMYIVSWAVGVAFVLSYMALWMIGIRGIFHLILYALERVRGSGGG